MTEPATKRAAGAHLRMAIFCGLFAAAFGLVLVGAYHIQVHDGAAWRALADKQRMRRLHVTPKRGTIYDRHRTPLAVSVDVPSVSVDAVEMFRGIDEQYIPMRMRQYAERVAAALHLDVARVAEKLARRRRFAWLKRRITLEESVAIRALGDSHQRYPVRGLLIEGEGRRFYPHRELAGPLLGFVSPDGTGRAGIELTLDKQLRGRAEEIRGLRDRAGRLIFSDGIQDEAALAGHDAVLTIDQGIQFIAERELVSALKTHEAKAGSVVVVDPATGALLALVSAPGYNPNDYNVSDAKNRRNHAVVDRFEPGSVMKVFSMAAALAAHTVKPGETIYCEEGSMPIDNVVIHDTHVSKWLTPTQIIQISSNIGISKIALGLGQRRLYEAFRRFGFGEVSGLPLPGEVSGRLRPRRRPWVPVETAAAAFGQGITVSNLQLAMAMAAVANKGRLLEPMLVQKVTDSAGVTLVDAAPKLRRRVVSARVTRLLTQMLSAVTEGEGTGVQAAVPGFRVAGKTATAQKVDPETGRYSDSLYVAAFVGFVPARRPRLVISVVVDEPMAGGTAGGAVAAPVFRRIAEATLRYLGVRPEGTKSMKLSAVAKHAAGDDRAERARGVHVAGPSAAAGTSRVGHGSRSGAAPGSSSKVPNLAGMPMRVAIQAVLEAGLDPVIEGTGTLSRSEPAAGSRVAGGSKLVLVFEPQI